MKHTPGPWVVDGKPGYDAPEVHAENRRIARVLYDGGSEDQEVDANACLIAAAPDLLEAARQATAFLLNLWGLLVIREGFAETCEALTAAVEKAIEKEAL